MQNGLKYNQNDDLIPDLWNDQNSKVVKGLQLLEFELHFEMTEQHV